MFKKGRIYIVIAILSLGFIILLQYNKPKEVNWYPSYVAKHKIPYGTYVLNDLIARLFPENGQQITLPPYQFLSRDNTVAGTYFFVNGTVTFGESELDALLEWTAKGNTLFVASDSFEEQLLDTLHLEVGSLYSTDGAKPDYEHQLVHPDLKETGSHRFEKDYYLPYFEAVDTLHTKIVGLVTTGSDTDAPRKEHVNIINQPFGEGNIVLSMFPKAFTNYFILKDNNRDYTAGLLSYIDGSKNLFIDNYHKSGKSFYTSPMHVFLNNKALKWAYYIALIGVVIYVLFEGKRKQRAIPVILPLKNQTLAFTRTIADMYFEKGEQKQIVRHKIDYFLDYIRSHLYLGTDKRDEEFYRKLAARSNHSVREVEDLFLFMAQLEKQERVSDPELKKLNTLIEKFKARADGKQ